MGIDIRDGQQMACITCGLCIDACDEIMDRVGKPRGLIGYLALSDELSEREGKTPKSVWSHVFRPRTILYTVLWAGIGLALIVALFLRTDIDMSVSPVRNPTHVVLSDGAVRNAYEVRLRNMHGEARAFTLSHTGPAGLTLSLEGQPGLSVTVAPDEQLTQRVYLTGAPDSAAAQGHQTPVRLWASIAGESERIYSDTIFNGRNQ